MNISTSLLCHLQQNTNLQMQKNGKIRILSCMRFNIHQASQLVFIVDIFFFFIFLDCLQRFVETETLDESEWYICNNCKKRQPSTKKFWILQLPNVSYLIIRQDR